MPNTFISEQLSRLHFTIINQLPSTFMIIYSVSDLVVNGCSGHCKKVPTNFAAWVSRDFKFFSSVAILLYVFLQHSPTFFLFDLPSKKSRKINS